MRNILIVVITILLIAGTMAVAQSQIGQNTSPASDYCSDLSTRVGGIAIPSGDVCDVVVVMKNPIIRGSDNMNLNRFTLMNSVLEFTKTGMANNEVYVMGDFALLESEMNNVLGVIKNSGFTITSIHNHMINESPKTTFVHWEAKGNLDQLVDQINQAFGQTSIKQ